MDEQAILRQIEKYMGLSDVDKALASVLQMKVDLEAVQQAKKKAAKDYLNTKPVIFPEDFAEEMKALSSELEDGDKVVKQLERIEDALEKRKQDLKKKK